MVPFAYTRINKISDAMHSQAGHLSSQANAPGTDFFAGGTDMLQLMRERVRSPSTILDISELVGLADISFEADKARLGALARMSDTASHAEVVAQFPVLAEALLASASPQIRNLATLGGNLLQRSRCGYFRDVVTPCNKREPGSGCPAIKGQNRLHAILGTSGQCIATYASDFANALLVLDAVIHISGRTGERSVPLNELHRLPGDTPHIETVLQPGEMITAIDVALGPAARQSHYLKVRDRATFEWSIASVAVALDLDSSKRVREVRIAVGGVATKPWRLPEVERHLQGKLLTLEACRQAGMLASEGAVSHGQNAYKVPLIQRVVTRGLEETGGLA